MTNHFLLLNSEILLIGPKNSKQNLLDHNLQLDGCTVTPSTVKNLGVILDSNLSFENHISHVPKTAFFHLRNIAKLRNMLTVSDAENVVHAFMTSRLDYCNALLGGCPASSINKLQIVQNAAARVITRSRKYDHITNQVYSLCTGYIYIYACTRRFYLHSGYTYLGYTYFGQYMCSLGIKPTTFALLTQCSTSEPQELPIQLRISYKILLLAYKALNDLAPAYTTNLLSHLHLCI